jgi:GNAT superfamily N-acetyltransferase
MKATLRRLVADDLEGLDTLYRSLSHQDRYLRFFTEVPSPQTVERYVTRLCERGFGVVAVDDRGRIVGEAGYVLLGSGDAEFGITVAPDSRGIGHVLLDSIVDHARRHGVAGLQADVLTENHDMYALAAKRGYALVHTDDYTVLRIIMGTATPVPPWPASTPHPRLLVETPACRWRGASAAEEAGFHVVSCPGPSSLRNHRCPPLFGQACPLVEGADAVVVALSPEDPNRGALTPIHRFCHARVPVFLQQAAGEERPAWLPDGLPTFPATASPAEIVESLRAAVAVAG